MMTLWTPTLVLKYFTLRLWVSFSRMRDLAHLSYYSYVFSYRRNV